MLITLETALLAKEKGFQMNSCTFYQYSPNGERRYELVGEDSEDEGFVSEDFKNRTAVCMQFVLHKWLRETQLIYVTIFTMVNDEEVFFDYSIKQKAPVFGFIDHPKKLEEHNFYETALEFGLQEALKLI